jgi:hypothetical protein
MPMHKREVVNHRRNQVAELYVQGRYQAEIGQLLGVTQQQVSLDLKAIQQEWLKASVRNFDTIRAEQLAKIDRIEREAWQAWERSLKQREVTIQEVTESATRINKVTLRKEGQDGDPRYLQVIQKCIDQRCDLLGLSTSTEAAKALGTGLAALLTQAQSPATLPGQILLPATLSSPLPEA